MQDLLTFSESGIYCSQGNFYIDPWKPVDYALITHGHSDHAYFGHKKYLCQEYTKPILTLRLGDINIQTIRWEEPVFINGVRVSFHPAGHIIGSAQIRVEYQGEVWVVSGDYKTEDDGISGTFIPLKCNTFITESTFGLPVFAWQPQESVYTDVINWINQNKALGQTSVLLAYSLGKAQRILQAIGETTQTIYAHGAVYNMQQTLMDAGWNLTPVERITLETPVSKLKGAVVIAPPGADRTPWMRKFSPANTGVCSGWMQIRGNIRRRNADAGFALSDHADWKGLIDSVRATEAERVYVTHGFQAAFSRYLNEEKIAQAYDIKTRFGQDEEDEGSVADTLTLNDDADDR